MSLSKWWNRNQRRSAVQQPTSGRSKLRLMNLEHRTLPAGLIAIGSDVGQVAAVRIRLDTDENDTYESSAPAGAAQSLDLHPFGGFTGGVRVAMGDFNGDGNTEMVTAAGPGGGPHVIIWDMNPDGTVAGIRDSFMAFDSAFRGGVWVAAGDLDGDGTSELAVAADAGGGPHVKIFSDTDGDGPVSDNLVDQFFAYGGGFTGGTRLAFGNTNNTGGDELIVAPGAGGGPHIKVFTDADADRAVTDGAVAEEFFAYDASFTGGVFVAAGALENAGGGGAEIITGPGAGGGPHVKVFTDSNADGKVGGDPVFDQFFAYDASFTAGVRVAAGDTDGSGFFQEVITAPGGAGQPVRSWDDGADAGSLISNDTPITQLAADSLTASGSYAAFGKVTAGTYAFNGSPVTIPDSSTINSTFLVPAGAGLIRDLDFFGSIAHSFDGDLDVTLTHLPSGKSVVLWQDVGGSNEGFQVVINDEAGTDISGATNAKADGAISGTFNPGGAALLSVFDGEDASGLWQLTIVDDSGGDTGTLFSWGLDITY